MRPVKIRIAELNIEIFNHFPFLERQCVDYLADFKKADMTVDLPLDLIKAEHAAAPKPVSIGYTESICVYREIGKRILAFDGFLFHASVVECDGMAFAFAAKSGTGKSTHTALWLKAFGERARIINGDKPIFRFVNGRLLAFGTPWCGKENLHTNASSPLKALCFLERDTENRIAALPHDEALPRLFRQVLMPSDPAARIQFFGLLDRMLEGVPVYLLGCNMSSEAALVAFHGMNKGDKTYDS